MTAAGSRSVTATKRISKICCDWGRSRNLRYGRCSFWKKSLEISQVLNLGQRNFNLLSTLGFISIYMATWEFVLVYVIAFSISLVWLGSFGASNGLIENRTDKLQFFECRFLKWRIRRSFLGVHWNCYMLQHDCRVAG